MNDVSKCDVIIWHSVSSYKPFWLAWCFVFSGQVWLGNSGGGGLWKCGGVDSGGGGKTKEMWWWWLWWRVNNGKVVVVLIGGTMSISALKHTHQLRGMDSTLRMRATISPQQWQLFRPRQGESKSTTLNFQLHHRQVLAVGWELQNSSPTECVWRTKNTLNKFPAEIDGLPVEGHKEKSFPVSSPI